MKETEAIIFGRLASILFLSASAVSLLRFTMPDYDGGLKSAGIALSVVGLFSTVYALIRFLQYLKHGEDADLD